MTTSNRPYKMLMLIQVFRCDPDVSFVIQVFPLWSRCFRCDPGVSVVIQVFPLCSRCFRCDPGVSVVIQVFPLWSRCFRCDPGVSVVIQVFPLWSRCFRCDPGVSVVIRVFPLWSRCFRCDPGVSIVIQVFPLWSRCFRCDPGEMVQPGVSASRAHRLWPHDRGAQWPWPLSSLVHRSSHRGLWNSPGASHRTKTGQSTTQWLVGFSNWNRLTLSPINLCDLDN